MFGGNCSLCGQWDPGAQRCGYPGAAQGHGWGSGELCPQQELEPDDPEGFSNPNHAGVLRRLHLPLQHTSTRPAADGLKGSSVRSTAHPTVIWHPPLPPQPPGGQQLHPALPAQADKLHGAGLQEAVLGVQCAPHAALNGCRKRLWTCSSKSICRSEFVLWDCTWKVTNWLMAS